MLNFRTALALVAFVSSARELQPGKFPKSFVESPINPPPWQYHAYNDKTYILRQSGFTNYEKPFLYMLFGAEKVFLLDTGSVDGHPSPVVAQVLTEYRSKKRRFRSDSHLGPLRSIAPNSDPKLDFVIGHSHSHWDHTAGDSELSNFTHPLISKTTLIPASNITAIKDAYAISSWPESLGKLDLGGRVLDVIPIPGHTPDSITVFDRDTGLLLTGDSVYPGRIFVPQSEISTFKASQARLRGTLKDREISWVLGCHVEQKITPFKEYPLGTIWQPNEHNLQLPVGILEDMRKAMDGVESDTQPGQIMFEEFSIVIE